MPLQSIPQAEIAVRFQQQEIKKPLELVQKKAAKVSIRPLPEKISSPPIIKDATRPLQKKISPAQQQNPKPKSMPKQPSEIRHRQEQSIKTTQEKVENSVKVTPAQLKPEKVPVDLPIAEVPPMSEATHVATSQTEQPIEHIDLPEPDELSIASSHDHPVPLSVVVDEAQEIQDIYEHVQESQVNLEVAETYSQIRQVLAFAAEEAAVEQAHDIYKPAHKEVLPDAWQNYFEVFLEEQVETTPKEQPTLESIQETVNDQPVEQTFAQLAWLIEHSASQDSTEIMPADNPIVIAVREIVEILPTCLEIDEATGKATCNISLEMTEKLVMLLQALGYQEPDKALLDMVRRQGLLFVLQACAMLGRRAFPEIRYKSVSSAVIRDSTNRLQDLGRLLLSLVGRRLFVESS